MSDKLCTIDERKLWSFLRDVIQAGGRLRDKTAPDNSERVHALIDGEAAAWTEQFIARFGCPCHEPQPETCIWSLDRTSSSRITGYRSACDPGVFRPGLLLGPMICNCGKQVEFKQPDPTPTPASRFVQVACWCERCDLDANSGMATRMALCPECGDKRCSRSEWHENECSTNRPTPTGGKTGHDRP